MTDANLQNMPTLTRVAPEIPVVDLHQSVAEYCQKLGFEVAMEMPSGDYAIVERDEVALHLFHDGARNHAPVALHIFTAGLEDLHRELVSRGADISQQITTKPWGNRDFRVRDASGNELKFTEPLTDS